MNPAVNPESDDATAETTSETTSETTAAYDRPRDPVEIWLARQWQNVLGYAVGIRENFFGLGGNSLDAALVVNAVFTELGHRLPLNVLTDHPTIESLAVLLREDTARLAGPLVAIQDGDGTRPPLVLVHPDDGQVAPFCRLAYALGEEYPVFALQAAGLYTDTEPTRTVAAMADAYADAVRGLGPAGPGLVGAGSVGAAVAYEMAVRLDGVRLLAAIGTELDPPGAAPGPGARAHRVRQANEDAVRAWRPSPYDGPIEVVDRAEIPGLPPTVPRRARTCGAVDPLAGLLRELLG